MNKIDVADYLESLESSLRKFDLLEKPGIVFNMDETSLQLNNGPQHVIAEKWSKNIVVITGKKGETITFVGCCHAEGTFTPPAWLFKGKNQKIEWMDQIFPLVPLFIWTRETSAYITTKLIMTWLQELFVPRRPEGPDVITSNWHSSHSRSWGSRVCRKK